MYRRDPYYYIDPIQTNSVQTGPPLLCISSIFFRQRAESIYTEVLDLVYMARPTILRTQSGETTEIAPRPTVSKNVTYPKSKETYFEINVIGYKVHEYSGFIVSESYVNRTLLRDRPLKLNST